MNRIAIIGGGAAGMMSAATASALGSEVILFERNGRLGQKLSITGKGRCNVTNNCTLQEFMDNVPTNPRFLYSAFASFTSQDTMEFFESRGVKLKTERGNRVFPESDKAADIVNALRGAIDCRVVNERVRHILTENGSVTGVETDKGKYAFERVIICTGGRSYPLTGSDGDGYRFARELGLEVTPAKPSLVPIETAEVCCAEMQGLSLKNTAIEVVDTATQKTVYSDFGEMMFTHFGVTGPMILSASAKLTDMERGRYKLYIDLKPALDEKTLDNRLLSDFSKYKNRDFGNSLSDLLPQKMIPVIVKLSGIPCDRKVNSVTREERQRLILLLKRFELTLTRFRPIEEAIITKGGVSVSGLNPKTMESLKIKGLYFAGEVIDVDAYTGGFNLQIAFSTAVCAARAASK